ncbi:hypothetical protein FB45DRAFT_1034889 [Roridomyces roridus]|uniref:DUF6534 domain-containing protein n=1 Tax=Roridomyces roridus TaxID=1738132 RepID=A0AAD7BC80_9AGAR|nr:hypothetical protein FB45DRAFT_1034889 [Roridomyces roridus]
MPSDIALTYGALLVGGSIALFLSGILSVQCIIYFRLYPGEDWRRNAILILVWILDLLHSAFIVTSLYIYFIQYFGDKEKIATISWSIALTVVVTAIQTLIVHWYFAHKIYQSSGKNWWITAPVGLLAFLRLSAAAFSTTEMILVKRFSVFTRHYPGWVFTTGLTLSAAVDIIITVWLCYFLQKMRRRTASTIMAHVVNLLTLYTLENGFITCVTTTASLICWLTMPTNLVFLGLHFVIGKLYANSLLISLNTRKELREMRWNGSAKAGHGWPGPEPVLTSADFTIPYTYTSTNMTTRTYEYGGNTSLTMTSPTSAYRPAFKVHRLPTTLEVSVERRVERTSDDLSDIIRNEYSARLNAQQYQYHRPRPRSPRHTVDPWRSLP